MSRETELKTELNARVLKYQTDKALGRHENIPNSNRLVELAKELTRYQWCKPEYKDVDIDMVLAETLKSYKADKGYDFVNYLGKSLTNKMKDVKKDEVKKEVWEVFSLDDDNIGAENFIESEQAAKEMQQYEETAVLYDCILNVVRTIQKEKERKESKTRCWDTYFFTEQIAEKIKYDKNMYDHICSNSKRYLSTISIDFINSYVKDKCSTINDIRSTELKSASEFGLKPTGPCGYKLVNEVYAQYFNVTCSSVTQQRNKYQSHITEKLKKEHL